MQSDRAVARKLTETTVTSRNVVKELIKLICQVEESSVDRTKKEEKHEK